MAKITHNRKVTEENRNWYKLGFLNGEDQLKETINKLRVAYGHLFDELTRLDEERPTHAIYAIMCIVATR